MNTSKPMGFTPDWKRREAQLRGIHKAKGGRRSAEALKAMEQAVALPKITVGDGSDKP